ncbi:MULTISPECIES: oligopeptide/dipeptide ABC transporter ATP-binding protein [unclassified Chelatococcus]|uniref:ABC transporter ATP-binding protein n=1 Tax=unclassified Chelatococcus TaxID=2638111 RepID=UPI001BCF52BB|nr:MULTISPECIES: oligopeptide/dipeptide ABC transporter ATP-binding protein [unclassified Chelatococcus]CAH1658853.1 Di/tripeptide transport ATP-binding protein DppF [Hyphomicrobiales bacterium]MBS7740856.1 ATP-binding cassette domain-containing protein [Chelatococcus sp. HY11]MBX3545910.1 ATP-binding cassette domain-containing protein [Chelatococcus sp.]MCO5079535.1 ATP-binding cassette domain-containing protein [Chelatococcus sp.]CAH1684012.1 Di/tripeptide transport ATP-binding protein DppF 
MSMLLELNDVSVTLRGPRPHPFAAPTPIRALRKVSLTLEAGETLALVGESGSGKSTLARAITRLVPAAGQARFDGIDILRADRAGMRRVRRGLQMVFQDPYSSLNRRKRIADILAEPLKVHGVGDSQERRRRVEALIAQVGLNADMLQRFPAALSGGQRQRISIARALALQPQLVICDEAVSALDVSVQAQILNLLGSLKRSYKLAYLFITHDLGVVRRFADRIAVMHAGRIIEVAPADVLFARPLHPYTRALLSAAPHPSRDRPAPQRIVLRGEPVSPLTEPPGCLFAGRCLHFRPGLCGRSDPALAAQGAGHQVACHRARGGLPAWVDDEATGGATP